MTVKVGAEIDAWCTKCRMDLSHRVVALLEGAPKRVECQTCNTQHNYRKPKGIKEPVPKAPSKAKAAGTKVKTPRLTKAQTEILAEWEERVASRGEGDFTAYSTKTEFLLDQLMAHKKFGNGFVAEVLDDNKISVVFREGPKILVHARE